MRYFTETFLQNYKKEKKNENPDNLRLPAAKISDHRSEFLQGSLY